MYLGEPNQGEELPAELPQLAVGDELRLHTGVVVDRNSHPVPNGTPVQFFFTYPQEGLEHSMIATTQEGIAETVITLDRAGQLDISIQADPAPRTVALQTIVQEGDLPTVLPITPTPMPTGSPLPPTSTPDVEMTTQEPPSPTPAAGGGEEQSTDVDTGAQDLVLAVIGVLVVGGVGYYMMRSNNQPVRVALRLGLWCVIGGLVLYVLYALLLPGVTWLQERDSVWTTGWIVLFGSLLPLALSQFLGWSRQPE